MKLLNFSCLLVLLLSLTAIARAQTWDSLYTYPIQDAVWDAPRVDVSHDDVIMASIATIRSNRPLDRSTDGGATWVTIDSNFQHAFIGFDRQNQLYVVSNTKISGVSLNEYDSLYYSSDLGDTWANRWDYPNSGWRPSAFYLDGQGQFYGLSTDFGPNLEQEIFRLKDGSPADTIFSPFDVGSNSLTSLVLLSNDTLVASSFNSGVYISTDGGQTWSESEGDSELGNATFAFFAEALNGDLFLAGPSLQISPDNGETWTGSTLGQNFVADVQVASNGVLYALTQFSGLFVSTDDGSTWTPIDLSFGGGSAFDMALSDNYLYLAMGDGKLYRRSLNSYQGGGSSTHVDAPGRSAFQPSPNPSQGSLHLAFGAPISGTVQVQVYDLQGRCLVLHRMAGSQSHRVDLPALKPGLYLLEVQQAGQRSHRMFRLE